jgi:hypothetical protein
MSNLQNIDGDVNKNSLNLADDNEDVEWWERLEGDILAARRRGDQWIPHPDKPHSLIVIAAWDEQFEPGFQERLQTAGLAQRARPGPDISDNQLSAAAAAFVNRYIEQLFKSGLVNGADDQERACNEAVDEVRHFAKQLSPYSCGVHHWQKCLGDVLKDIRQENRREFLDKLALWKPLEYTQPVRPPIKLVKCWLNG